VLFTAQKTQHWSPDAECSITILVLGHPHVCMYLVKVVIYAGLHQK